jgi:hypothetical protein
MGHPGCAERSAMSIQSKTRPGSVLQINPSHKTFGNLLVIVDTVEPWGVLAFFLTPMGKAYVQIKWDDLAYVGEAVYRDV